MEQLPLLAKLNEVFSSADDLMVTLLLDGSGSVATQWAEVKQLSLDLVKKLENVDVQIIQFSTVARTECPFTKKKEVLEKTVGSMYSFHSLFIFMCCLFCFICLFIYSFQAWQSWVAAPTWRMGSSLLARAFSAA